TYRQRLVASLPGTADAATTTVTLQVKYQGCADLGICYPPQTRVLKVRLPAATAASAAAPDAGFAALGRALSGAGAPAPLLGTSPGGQAQALPLPAEQAFGFEAIAGDGNTILMRFTPAKGYYLYRDRNSFRIEGANGIVAGTPEWPKGVAHRDEHFGDVTVYFDQVDVPLPVRRSVADAASVTLTATFQGCQDEGICYPPMTRTVQVALPAGKVETVAEAAAALAAEATQTSLPPPPSSEDAADVPGPDGEHDTTPSGAAATADASADNAARTAAPPANAL